MRVDVRPPSRLRVAMFTDTFVPQMNGVAKTLARWERALVERGHEVRVFTTSCPNVRGSECVVRYPSVSFWAYKELRLALPFAGHARDALRRWRPSLVHAATPFGVGLAGRSAARSLELPLVTSYHTSLTEYAKYYGLGALSGVGMRFLRWFHNAGRRTFVPTRAISRELTDWGFTGLSLWSRGVDTVRFHPGYRDTSLRAQLGAEGDTIIVAYVGRIASEKGVEFAAQAMREVKALRPRTIFAVAGDGPAMSRVRAMSPSDSRFVGRLSGDPLSAFYASADIFVFPSTTDTFGNVLTEAMASGLAIVAADVPQSREVVGEAAGDYATPNDPRAFASAIVRLIDNRSRLASRRHEAVARARTCSWKAVFDDLVDDYRDAMFEHHEALRRAKQTRRAVHRVAATSR